MLDADALAESVVGLDQRGELALGIGGEGQGDALALGKFLGEIGKDGEAGDLRLIGEDSVAVFVADGAAVRIVSGGG